jgi:hypothetical protein
MYPVHIYNQCSDFDLVSPAYFGRNAIWIRPPDQKVDANAMTRASFGIHVIVREFASALIYKLQRKNSLESDNQLGIDSTYTEDTSTSLQLLLIWGYNDEYRFSARVLLIKHSNTITWNDDTLEKLHSMHLALCRNDYIVKETWMLDDATVLMAASKWEEYNYAFKITLSDGTRKNDTREPLWVSSNM